MSVLLIGDLHLSDRPPSSCTDSYLDDLFDLLEQTVVLSDAYEAVVWAGDIFHHKAPSRTSHRTIQRTLELCNAYPVPPFIVPGNHDVQNDRLESVLETQPLGVLFRSGAARPLIGWSPYVPYLYGVPWQQDWANLPNALAEWPVSPWDESGCLVVTHAPIFPVSMAPTVFEYTPAADWAAAMGGKGNVYYGHIHEAHGVYTDGGVTFANVGALSRGSLHEYDLTRQVSVCSWSASTGFTPIPLNAKPASEVFRLAEIMEAKDATGAFDDFLANVGNSTIAITSIESVMEEVGQRDGVTPQLAALVRDLLANVA